MLIAINISNILLAVKHYHLGHGKQTWQIKWQYQLSIKNKILYLNFTSKYIKSNHYKSPFLKSIEIKVLKDDK